MAAPRKDPITLAIKAVKPSARRGATPDRRYWRCVENALVGEHGYTPEQAHAVAERSQSKTLSGN